MRAQSTSATTPAAAPRRSRRRRPGPFPVTIIRPAHLAAPELTAAQRQRQQDAARIAAALTEAARHGNLPYVSRGDAIDLEQVPEAQAIVRTAVTVAANPRPHTARFGRDTRGRCVAVLLHGDTWSLVLRHPRHGLPASTWSFLDGYGDSGSFLPFCFDDQPSVLGVEWTDMVRDLLARTT